MVGEPNLMQVKEFVGEGAHRQQRVFNQTDQKWTQTVSTGSSNSRWLHVLQSMFLPEGYPDSVTPDYLSFQVWDSVQALSSYLRGMLCTQALLIGVGVGVEGASATSAAVTWVLRDGAGMLGSVLFAWLYAANFGLNIRKWRLFADIINDIGLTLELFAPIFPEYFLLIASLGSVCKAMCGVSAGATRSALSLHFARTENVGDITAKEGIQETTITLIGLVTGMLSLSLSLSLSLTHTHTLAHLHRDVDSAVVRW